MIQLNHTEYRKKVKRMSEDQLRYTIKDCREAIEAMPHGPKAGWYMDEIHYCAAELKRRFG
jgi:hypothetical protein